MSVTSQTSTGPRLDPIRRKNSVSKSPRQRKQPSCSGDRLPAIPGAAAICDQSSPWRSIDSLFTEDVTWKYFTKRSFHDQRADPETIDEHSLGGAPARRAQCPGPKMVT